MDFFDRQRHVRAASRRLVFLFILAVLAITAIVNVAVLAATVSGEQSTPEQLIGLSVLVSGATLLMIGGVSTVRTMMLRSGGGVKVAESLGAVRIPDMPTEAHLKRYRNVVEEIAIASSTPVPVLYYLPNEQAINAFAAGYSPADAAVCVTQGSLDRLNRDELQGVIAHEFSHIVNGDMRLSLRLIGVLAGITALSVIGRTLWYVGGGRGRDSDNSRPRDLGARVGRSGGGLDRGLLRTAYQSSGLASAGVSCRCVSGPIHATDGRTDGRAEEDRWAPGRLPAG